MNDLKEFLEINKQCFQCLRPYEIECESDEGIKYISHTLGIEIEDLGLFLWGRGGKQFVKMIINECKYTINELLEYSKDNFATINGNKRMDFLATDLKLIRRDFLDCVACLGEEKVKELISELEGKE